MRDWCDEQRVRDELDAVDLFPLTVVHGACPTGADAIADAWCRAPGNEAVTVERHPADWTKEGRAAGPIRNSLMASAGADLCLAFWDGHSKGTADMIRRAVECGIPVSIVPKVTPPPRVGDGRK
jgi:hypothetical protein